MVKNIKIEELKKFSKSLHNIRKKIVLVGGCFDILHIGHIEFFEKAKKLGDVLIVLLESDNTLKELKGLNRPIHTQKDRAKILTSIKYVDFVVLLPEMNDDKSYDDVIFDIKPDIIAHTIGDVFVHHKKRQAKKVGAQIVEIPKTASFSTSQVARLLEKEV